MFKSRFFIISALIAISSLATAQVRPIQEIFEPKGDYPIESYAKVAVLQWAPSGDAPLGSQVAADQFKQSNINALEAYIREAAQNGAILIKRDGVVAYQDKLFLTPWEAKHGWSNGKRLKLFNIDGVTAVILICHDSEFPVVSQAIAKIKPELIIVPSMTDDVYGHARVSRTSQARAIEHMSYVLQVGTTSKAQAPWHSYYGNGALMTPQNSSFKDMESQTNIGSDKPKTFVIDADLLRQQRKKETHIYPARDQNQRADPIIVDTSLVEGAQ